VSNGWFITNKTRKVRINVTLSCVCSTVAVVKQ